MNFFTVLKEKFFIKPAADKWDKAMRWLLLAAVFIMPLFFLSPQNHSLEFNKVFLFDIVVLAAAVLFFLKAVLQREIRIIRTPYDWPILAFVFFSLIAFIFSQNHYVSLAGLSGFYSGGFISTVCFVLFFYLLLQAIKTTRDLHWFTVSLLGSSLLVMVFSLLQIAGLYLLPWEIVKNASFNLVANSTATLAVFTAIVSFIGFGLFLATRIKWEKIASGIFVLLGLALLFCLNKEIALYLLVINIFIFLILITFKSRQLSNWWVVLPTILLTLVVLFVFVGAPAFMKNKVSESVVLDQKTSGLIAWRAFLHTPLWGTGQQTFTHDFNEFRQASFNDTDLWNLRFIKGSNEWFNYLATLGAGGMVSMLLIGFWFAARNIWLVVKSSEAGEVWSWQLIFAVAWLLILMASFFMAFNFILYFLWWLLLALGLRIENKNSRLREFNYSSKKSPIFSLFAALLFFVFLAGAALVIFFGGRGWLADYYYAKAQRGINDKADISTVIQQLRKAVSLNPYEAKNYLSLAQGYATQAILKAGETNAKTEEVQQQTQQVIDNIKKAVSADPKNPAVYEQEVSLYDNLRNLVSNIDELSVEAYTRAVELEPTNPLLYLNLGRARLLQAQAILATVNSDTIVPQAKSLLDQSIQDFNKAKELKKDFIVADYNIGLAYQAGSEWEKALSSYREVLKQLPNSVETHWQIAAVYEQQKKIDEAIKELETVQKLAPDNQQVKDKLEKLRSQVKDAATP